jgi:hypothetical protein
VEVAETFARFQQGAVTSYLATLPDYVEMTDVEARILERVARRKAGALWHGDRAHTSRRGGARERSERGPFGHPRAWRWRSMRQVGMRAGAGRGMVIAPSLALETSAAYLANAPDAYKGGVGV